MNTIPQLNTWQGLFWLLVVLIITFWCFKLLKYSLEQLAIRNVFNKQLLLFSDKAILFFTPIAVVILLLNFISINYISHSIILVIISVFGFSQIKNYINGLFLKSNPMIQTGSKIQVGEYIGDIKKFLLLGVKLNTENGVQYINYSTVSSLGFTVKPNTTSVLTQTLYLETDKTPEQILDLLFSNPILNYNQPPTINKTENKQLKLQYTTENGASSKELIYFLEDNNIQTSQINTSI